MKDDAARATIGWRRSFKKMELFRAKAEIPHVIFRPQYGQGLPMLGVDEEILLNQLAQGIVSDLEGDAWFQAQNEDGKRRLLLGLNVLILQASPRQEDAAVAISEARLKQTLTPSVLIMKPGLKVQLAKLVRLPESELPQVFKLLIKLLRSQTRGDGTKSR